MKSLAYLVLSLILATAPAAQNAPKPPPRIPDGAPPPSDVTCLPDQVYGTADGRQLLLDLAIPKGATKALPAVILVHGGGWVAGNRRGEQPTIYRLAQAGFVGASVEYRLASRQVENLEMVQDCKCAVRFLRANAPKYHVDAAHIGAMGSSAGGQLVSMMGVTNGDPIFEGTSGWPDLPSDVQAVVDWFGPIDIIALNQAHPDKAANVQQHLTGLGKTAPSDVANAALTKCNPITYLAPGRNYPPFLILHGDADPAVPFQQSKKWAAALSNVDKDVTLHILPGEGHGAPTAHNPKWWPEVLAFLRRTLK
jgi:acetyl esterase/lipase